ncbi:MAG: hemerythrin domain-containing protein [Candidatus Neomarinimicrobiota bacterium]
MSPIEELKKEHNSVLLSLQILEKMYQYSELIQEVNFEQLDRLLEFFQVFVDRCHHGKEENALFPALADVGVPVKGGPIGVMLDEHKSGRVYVHHLWETHMELEGSGTTSIPEFVYNSENYIRLLRQHIDKENNVLYPIAEKRLSPEKMLELTDAFEKIETEKVGVGKHEQFHHMLKSYKDYWKL